MNFGVFFSHPLKIIHGFVFGGGLRTICAYFVKEGITFLPYKAISCSVMMWPSIERFAFFSKSRRGFLPKLPLLQLSLPAGLLATLDLTCIGMVATKVSTLSSGKEKLQGVSVKC